MLRGLVLAFCLISCVVWTADVVNLSKEADTSRQVGAENQGSGQNQKQEEGFAMAWIMELIHDLSELDLYYQIGLGVIAVWLAGCMCNCCCVGIKIGNSVKARRLQEKFENIETVEDSEQFYEESSGKRAQLDGENENGFKEWKEEDEHPPMVREADEADQEPSSDDVEKEKL